MGNCGKASCCKQPLKPKWAVASIEAMATFVVAAELIALLAAEEALDAVADMILAIDHSREQCIEIYAESLFSSMPAHEAQMEIERLRCYQTRLIEKKREAMNVSLRSDFKSGKRSQKNSANLTNAKVTK